MPVAGEPLGAGHAEPHDHAADHEHPAEHDHAENHEHKHGPGEDQEHVHADAHEHGHEHDHEAGALHDHRAADQGEPAAAGDSVQLTKEQQWLSDFATAVVERRILRGSVPASGVLRASADGGAHITAPIDAHLRSAAGGFPYNGLRVEPGQTLAYLVPRLSGEADVAGLELAVTRAATALDLARQERERLDALWEDRSIPFREVLQAGSDEEVAAAELSAARRRLAQMQRTEEGEGAGVPVRAPIGGVVALTPANGARLVAYGAMIDPESRTVPIVFEFERAGHPNGERLRVGQSVSARVYTGEVSQACRMAFGKASGS